MQTKTRFHFKHAQGLHSSKSNLRGEAEHAVPEAGTQPSTQGWLGYCLSQGKLGRGEERRRSIPINLPESAQALTLLTADIWKEKKPPCRCHPASSSKEQMVKRQNMKLRAQVQAGQKAKSIIFQHQGRDPTAAHKQESDTSRNSLKIDHKSLHSGSSSRTRHSHFSRWQKLIFHVHP